MQTHVSWKRPLILAVTLTVLGGGAYWLEYSHKPKKEEDEKASKKLFNLKDTQVSAISLIDGDKKYVFRCLDLDVKLCRPGDQSKWEMESPSKMRGDDGNINSVLSSINNLSPTSTIELGEESSEKKAALLKEYGLSSESRNQEGARRIEVTLASGEKRTLFFGETHPMGGALLTLSSTVGEDKIFLSPGYFKSNFEKDLTYWRNKKLFTISSSQVKGIALAGGTETLSSERKESDWTLTVGKGQKTFKADSENIDSLISSATFLTAKKFVAEKKDSPEAVAALKGTRKALTLTLTTDQGPTVLDLYERTHVEKGKLQVDAVYATVSTLDPVFELDKTAKDRLNKSAKDLRMTKLLTTSERFETRRIEFSGKPLGEKPLVLESKEGKWSMKTESTPKEVPADRIQTTLDRLTGNRIKDFLSGGSIPKGESDGVKVKVSNEKGDSMKELLFWKKDTRLFARDLSNSGSEAFLVDAIVQESLPWSADFFEKEEKKAPESVPAGHSDHGHEH